MQTNKTEWILFPSIYFGGLFPHLTYLRQQNRAMLRGPLTDYHDRRIINAYMLGLSAAECAISMEERDVISCRQHFSACVRESSFREASLPIKVMHYVIDNFHSSRTFHTFNHPSNDVMWHVVRQFLALLGLSMSVERPPVNQYLNDVTAAISLEMAEAVGLKFVDDEYSSHGVTIPRISLIEQFFRLYDSVADFPALCSANPAPNLGAPD
ncbi:MAG: hypothetical protein H9532_11370 [Vulcanococcus sp. Clear-D1]|nr:hypothetical protein [Vulcanococcus sp. Clear-D1]